MVLEEFLRVIISSSLLRDKGIHKEVTCTDFHTSTILNLYVLNNILDNISYHKWMSKDAC